LAMVVAAAVAVAAATKTTPKQTAFVKPLPSGLRGVGAATTGGTIVDRGQQQRTVKVAVAKDEATTNVVGDSGASNKGSDMEDEDNAKQLQGRLFDLLSMIFWAFFIRFVFIQGYIIDPAQLRASAVMEGLGGIVLPVYPQV